MPTYDYLCDACEHKFELFQSIKDSMKKKCPICGKPKLRRLFGTGAAIMFKGSGFYTTDYRSDSYKQSATADTQSSETKSSGEAKSGGESEASDSSSKPASSESREKSKQVKE